MRLDTLTLTRNGRAVWHVSGPNHCGSLSAVKNGLLLVDWSLVMVCEPSLDEHGFLYDQARMGDFVDSLGAHVSKLSCERLVDSVARKILGKIHAEAPTCDIREFSFSLAPDPFVARMTATYHQDH